MSTDLEEFESNVCKWGTKRNFYDPIDGTTLQAQFVKLAEELGELAGNIARGKPIEDDIGDMLVVMVNLTKLSDTNLKACAGMAWDEIKDRKGRMENGVFIKDE